ncbi:protein-export chaperone SecB [Undibacterium sp. WLX3042]|uniref:protein-export chaperone SecB n=1 Tax=Undibacterium sp. WLX3042 TaxID=3412686 RepID=UPI003C2C9A89
MSATPIQIKPVKFQAQKVVIGDPDDIDIGERDLSLRVVCQKLSDNSVAIIFNIKLKVEDISLQVLYAVDFEVACETDTKFVVSDETIEHPFMNVNAPAIGYPFVRAYIGTLLLNSGYKPFMLPPVNFQALYTKKKALKIDKNADAEE